MAKPKTTTTNQKPERAFLRVDHTGELSPDVQSAVNDLHRDAVAWEAGEADRTAKLEAIADAAHRDSVTIGELRKLAREIGKLRDGQFKAGVTLQWRRFEIMPRIVPDAERSVVQRTAEMEALIAAKIEQLTEAGILRAMPGGESEVGIHQLRTKLLRDDFDCLAARGRLTIAEDELRAANANALLPPSSKCVDRTVPVVGIELADLIMRQEVLPVEEPHLTEPAQTLREALGLKGAPLLSEHVNTLHAIQDAMGVPDGGNGWYPANFRKVTAAVGERVAELIEQLPQNEARNRAMQDCRESNRDERRFGGSKPRTTYLDRETNEMVEAAS